MQNARERDRRREAVADGGQVARASAIEAQARQRAQEVGRAGKLAAQRIPRRRGLDQERERIEPFVDRGRVGQRAGEALGHQAGAGGRDGEVDGRQQRSLARAAERARELEVGAGRRIDLEARAARPSGRRRQGRTRLELGALDVSQRQRRRRDLGARKGAEAVEGLDAVEFANPPLGRRPVARLARERRRGNAEVGDEAPKRRLVEHRLRSDDLGGLEPRDFCGKARFVRLRQGEGPGRQIERRKSIARAPVARPDPLHGDEEPRPARLEQALLGDRAGRDEPHDVALDDRFRAAPLRFGRILELLADRDAMAERDQAVEVVVGALDRHAAHADVLAVVLAALGEHDAERAARDLRVVEEELVEVAHPVEQQAIRVGRLDLEVLRHHRRQALRSGFEAGIGNGAYDRGVHRAATLANRRPAREGARRDIHGTRDWTRLRRSGRTSL